MSSHQCSLPSWLPPVGATHNGNPFVQPIVSAYEWAVLKPTQFPPWLMVSSFKYATLFPSGMQFSSRADHLTVCSENKAFILSRCLWNEFTWLLPEPNRFAVAPLVQNQCDLEGWEYFTFLNIEFPWHLGQRSLSTWSSKVVFHTCLILCRIILPCSSIFLQTSYNWTPCWYVLISLAENG